MRLLVWSPEFSGFGGGIGAFSRELAGGLAVAGHEVRLVGKFDRPGAWNGLPLWGAGQFSGQLQNVAFAAGALAIAKRFRPHRIVSCHLNFGPVALMIRRLLGIPFTLVAHGIDVHPKMSGSRKAALRAADRVVAVSSWTRARLAEIAGVDTSRIAILHNTFDDDRFSVGPAPSDLRRKFGIPQSKKVILTVARLDLSEPFLADGPRGTVAGHKGCDNVIRAMPEILRSVQAHYVIAGRGSDRPRLEALARQVDVSQHVTFAGFVPDAELADYYRMADVFAMPSKGEGFGIVFLEAMGCGTPVLAGNLDGSVDALEDGVLGVLVDPMDVAAIATGVVSLLKQSGPDLWFNRTALHERVTARFGQAAFLANLDRAL